MQNGIEFTYVDLLKEPPEQDQLEYLTGLLNIEIAELVNKKSQAYRNLKPDLNNMSTKEIAAVIKENPRIMLRPILTDGGNLLLGFNEERYQEFTGIGLK